MKISYDCFNCKIDKGQVYASEGKWLCNDCWENLLKEKLPAKKATQRIMACGKKKKK